MSPEPIFDRLTADAHDALADAERLAQRARAYLAAHIHKEGTTMSIATDIENDVHAFMDTAADAYNKAKTFAEQRLPQASALLEAASGNPLVSAALSAVHVSPEILQSFAEALLKMDSDIAALTPAPAVTVSASDGVTAEPVPDGLPAQ
jgi:hypothetical protein